MAYSILNFVQDDNSGSSTTIDAPNFTVSAGSALVCWVWCSEQTQRTVTMSDTVGSNDTWTEVGSGLYSDPNQMRCFYLLNASGGSCTVRATFSTTVFYPTIAVAEIGGIVTSSALVGNAAQTQASPGTGTDGVTSGNTGTLTSQPAAVLAMTQNTNTDSTPAAGTGYTSQDSYRAWDYGGATFGGRFEHKRVTATTAVAGTFTAGTNQLHQTILVALAESGTSQSNAPRAAHLMKLMGAM